EAYDLPVDAGADVAALEHVGAKILEFALLPADDRGQDQELAAGRQGHDPADNLFAALGGDRPAALRAVALANAGVEDTQEVVDFGDRADRRARVPGGGFLLDADRRRQAAEVID